MQTCSCVCGLVLVTFLEIIDVTFKLQCRNDNSLELDICPLFMIWWSNFVALWQEQSPMQNKYCQQGSPFWILVCSIVEKSKTESRELKAVADSITRRVRHKGINFDVNFSVLIGQGSGSGEQGLVFFFIPSQL